MTSTSTISRQVIDAVADEYGDRNLGHVIEQTCLDINRTERNIRDLAAAISQDMARLAGDLDARIHLSSVGSRPADLDRAITEREAAWKTLGTLCGPDIAGRLSATQDAIDDLNDTTGMDENS